MTKPPTDPTAMWQDFVQKWEHEVNDWSTRLTQSDQFSAALGQATKYTVFAQRAMAEQMEAMLKSLNLPSKTQIDQLSERLAAVEDGLERLRLSMTQQGAQPEPAKQAEPRRTRKPPQDKA